MRGEIQSAVRMKDTLGSNPIIAKGRTTCNSWLCASADTAPIQSNSHTIVNMGKQDDRGEGLVNKPRARLLTHHASTSENQMPPGPVIMSPLVTV